MRITFSVLLISALCSIFSPIASAQLAPVCRAVAADADGDGFGWQDGGSCIVTSESDPVPEFINRETSERVKLIRAYWNPPVDLYNKTIDCFANNFSNDEGRYVPDNDPSRETHYTFHYTHFPLTATAPFTGSVHSEHFVTAGPISDFHYEDSYNSWSMDNGIYTGAAPFGSSPYVEIITVPSTNEKAVRTWGNESWFVQCSATPTGVPPGTASSSEDEATVESLQSTQQDQMPEVEAQEVSVEEEAPAEDQSTVSSDEVTGVQNSAAEDTNSANTDALGNGTSDSDSDMSDVETTSTVGLSNPFAAAGNGGGGAVGVWLLLLWLAGFSQRVRVRNFTGM